MKRVIYDQADRVGRWVCERTGGLWSPVDSSALGLEHAGELVAGAIYDSFNGASIRVHLAGDGGSWLNREFLRAGFRYPFLQLRVRKLIGLVDSSNTRAIRFDEHIGFRLEAVVKDAAPHGDLLIYTMRREECRHLGD